MLLFWSIKKKKKAVILFLCFSKRRTWFLSNDKNSVSTHFASYLAWNDFLSSNNTWGVFFVCFFMCVTFSVVGKKKLKKEKNAMLLFEKFSLHCGRLFLLFFLTLNCTPPPLPPPSPTKKITVPEIPGLPQFLWTAMEFIRLHLASVME